MLWVIENKFPKAPRKPPRREPIKPQAVAQGSFQSAATSR